MQTLKELLEDEDTILDKLKALPFMKDEYHAVFDTNSGGEGIPLHPALYPGEEELRDIAEFLSRGGFAERREAPIACVADVIVILDAYDEFDLAVALGIHAVKSGSFRLVPPTAAA